MATLDDVETGVTQALASMLFPGAGYLFNQVGTALAPYTNTPDAPVLSMPAKLYPGDPNTDTLDKDLHLGTAHIAVQHAAGYSRDTTRFLQYRTRVSANVASLSIATQGNQAVLGGVCGSGQVVAITAGKTCYAYLTVANDTIASVMAALAANIHGAIASGAILTAPGLTAAVVVVPQRVLHSTGQQQQVITVTIYAPPVKAPVAASGALVRAALGSLVNGLKSMRRTDGSLTRWIGLPDGDRAQVEFFSETDNDRPDRADMWLRQVRFMVEYDETVPESATPVVAPLLSANLNGGVLMWIGNGRPSLNVLTNGHGGLLGDASGRPIGSAT